MKPNSTPWQADHPRHSMFVMINLTGLKYSQVISREGWMGERTMKGMNSSSPDYEQILQ